MDVGQPELLQGHVQAGSGHPGCGAATSVSDPYDWPELPLVKRLIAVAADLTPDDLYGVGEGDGRHDQIAGILAQEERRTEIAIANTMGLDGDWGTDDVTEAVVNALHEYRQIKAGADVHRVNRALLETHIRQAMDSAARNPATWRSMLEHVVDGCADALDATLHRPGAGGVTGAAPLEVMW